MCERCREPKTSLAPVTDSGMGCEWHTGTCEREAVVVITDTDFTHLCDRHMREESGELDEGRGEFLKAVGFVGSTDFLPITEAASCERAVTNPLQGDREILLCGEVATWAKREVDGEAVCAIHAREMGYEA